ncbi:hypothetical protein Acr_16g0001030 [Actinidia rufa]|uniref:Reverse transcriptase domain-containing protein n=1 Tax=Actinidia rufa TaxID=165716 RepID=A0A7J0FXR3_9ERIC|nr:hypothetical protein Acr_16g0001030 [Actinidia rufa]
MREMRDEIGDTHFLDPRDTKNSKPLEEVTPISIHSNHLDRHVMIGAKLTKELRDTLVEFLKKNYDVFAWLQGDVPGIDPHIAVHKLFATPDHHLVRQKMMKFAPKRLKVIEEEAKKWKVCVDFTDLNKVCPKDNFSFPKIDLIVDVTSKYELLSLMDAFFEYHQIKMYLPDIEKTSFIMERRLYCYKFNSFGLKNAKAMYQRLINRMFKELIEDTMEVYINDMLVKSLKAKDHIAHLERTFSILRHHCMILNPSKCIFNVLSEKFLTYLAQALANVIAESTYFKEDNALDPDVELTKGGETEEKTSNMVRALSTLRGKDALSDFDLFVSERKKGVPEMSASHFATMNDDDMDVDDGMSTITNVDVSVL